MSVRSAAPDIEGWACSVVERIVTLRKLDVTAPERAALDALERAVKNKLAGFTPVQLVARGAALPVATASPS